MHSPRGAPLANPAAEHLRLGLARLSEELRTGTLDPSDDTASTGDAGFLGELRGLVAALPKSSWPRLAVSFNEDQVESKLWLLEHLATAMDVTAHRIVILGAWYGLLALMMDRLLERPPTLVNCVDIDHDTCELARRLLSVLPSPPDVIEADMLEMDYEALAAERSTLLINTSCEHLPDFAGWRERVPPGTRLVVQSNNHLGCSEHVNCVPDVNAFVRQARLSHIDFQGTLPLRHFDRFMLMGRV